MTKQTAMIIVYLIALMCIAIMKVIEPDAKWYKWYVLAIILFLTACL